MFQDDYISDMDLNRIRQIHTKKTSQFLHMRKNAKKMYRLFGVMYPYQAENNFRDSWFHYRKIYVERGTKAMIGQMSMFDEHLQRAEKDIVVCFWTRICRRLEFWYKDIYDINFSEIEQEALAMLKSIWENKNGDWAVIYHSKCRERFGENILNGEIAFAHGCIYAFKHLMNIDKDFHNNTQKLLHKIKKEILEVRYGGTDIKRHDEPGIYLEQFEECMEALVKLYRKNDLFAIMNVTDAIIGALGIDDLK